MSNKRFAVYSKICLYATILTGDTYEGYDLMCFEGSSKMEI